MTSGSTVALAPSGRNALPMGSNLALLAHRFERIEPRLKQIEAFVTSKDFELHRDFRRMGE